MENNKNKKIILVSDIMKAANNWKKVAQYTDDVEDSLEMEKNILLLLSSELYLKAIIVMEDKEYTKNHSLYELFCSIDDNKQERIKSSIQISAEDYCSLSGEIYDFSDFDKILKHISLGFIEYRYGFEKIYDNKGFVILPDFIKDFNDEVMRIATDMDNSAL